MVIVTKIPSNKPEIKDFIYQFLRLGDEGFWCIEILNPPSIHDSIKIQAECIWNSTMLVDCNDSFAKLIGQENRDKVLGKELKTIPVFGSVFNEEDIRILIQSNYKSNYEKFLKADGWNQTKYLQNSAYGIVKDEKLIHICGSLVNLTAAKEIQVKLEKTLDFEKLIGSISRSFISMSKESLNSTIDNCLSKLGEFTNVDRSYVFLLSEDKTKISNTHEWCREGISSHIHEMKDINYNVSLSHTWNSIVDKNVYWADSIENMSLMTEEEMKLINTQGIQSILLVGIRKDGYLLGFVGFDSVLQTKKWIEEDFSMLNIFADILSFSFQNHYFQEELIKKEESLSDFYDRISFDLEIAKETQKNLVSLDFPKSEVYQLTSFFRPFEKVGGDIISYHSHDDYIDILFGDVSGHGISSAMVSGMVILSFRNSSRLNETPLEVLSSMNRDLRTVVLNHHISAVCVRYYPSIHKFVYSYAGHPPLVLIRNSEIIELEGMNTPLLTIENINYFENELILVKDDRIVFYSDGCYEVFSVGKEFLGLYNYLEILKDESNIKDSSRFIQNSILKVLNFCAGDIRDDLTMLILDVK
jgi:sigma-B regulation protein RsbU (phosphoserine phosphatase)